MMTKYKIIFSTGYDDDVESLSKDLRCDVLILDTTGNYYNPQFITTARIIGEFTSNKVCFLEENLVVLHKVTKDNIIKSLYELHQWQFYKRWLSLTPTQVETYFYPIEDWVTIEIEL